MLSRIVKLVVLSLIVVLPALAQAQESSAEQNQQSQPQLTSSGKMVKAPPLPLYSKHRRGIYRDSQGFTVIDATPQSPPLETDDPGVPEKGEYEINLTTHADLSRALRSFDFLFVDANYGIVPQFFGHELPTQVKFEFPLAGAKVPGEPVRAGIGAAKFGLKFNFYNNLHKGVYVSLYPQIEFNVPGSHAVQKDLAEPGQSFILPLLVQKEFKYLTMVANVSVEKPIHNPESETTALSFGFGRAITRYMAAMGEVHLTSTLDLQRERLLVVNFGLMRHVRDNIVVYAKLGRSVFSDEVFGHTYVGVGVKFELTPEE